MQEVIGVETVERVLSGGDRERFDDGEKPCDPEAGAGGTRSEGGGRGHPPRTRAPPEVEKGKESDSPHRASRRTQPCRRPDVSLVRPHTFLQNCEGTHLCGLKLPRVW